MCLYMWLHLRPPFEAATVHLLLEEIRLKAPPIERAVVASEEMMALLLGLLARRPTQRLRVEDLRRNQLLTRCAEMPPRRSAMAQGQLARDEAKEELRGAVSLAMVALRPQAMLMEPLRAGASEDAPTRSPTEIGGELTEHRARNTAVRGVGKDKVLTGSGPREASRMPGQLHGQLGSAEHLNALEC